MAQTLKITLPASVDSGVDYLKLGEMRIKVETIVEGAFVQMNITTSSPTNARIVGNTTTQFASLDGTSNIGKTVSLTAGTNTLRFKANSTFFISIENKFVITKLGDNVPLFSMVGGIGNVADNIRCYVNLKDLKYINYTQLWGDRVFYGDIADINKTALTSISATTSTLTPNEGAITGIIGTNTFNYASLTSLVLSNQKKLSGSITGANLTNITNSIYLGNTGISGSITALNNSITGISFNNTDISLNLSVLSGKTLLTTLALNGSLAYGDIASLSSVNIQQLADLKGLTLSGDVAQLNNNTIFISNTNPSTQIKNNKAHLSTTYWTNKKAGRQYILASEMALTLGVDQYLIDMASLDLHPSSVSGGSWLRTINIRGTRTSASDAAVTTLASKGVTVIVNQL